MANILLVGIVINKATYGYFWLPILGSFLMMTSTTMLLISSFAYTEPMFIFFTTFGLYLLCIYFENSKKIFLIFSGLFIALSLLTRYAGFPCIITGIIGICLLSRANYHKRIIDSLIFMTISLLPMSIWGVRNLYLSGNATGRSFVYHQVGFNFFKDILAIMSTWLFPMDYLSVHIRALLLLAIIIMLLIFVYQKCNKNIFKTCTVDNHFILSLPIIPSLYLIYFILYLLFILFSKSFFDVYIPINSRILSPLLGPFFIILLYLFYKIYKFGYRSHIKISLFIFCFLLATVYLIQGLEWAINARKDGGGYNSIVYKKSEILNYVKNIKSKKIYSNACDAVYIVADKKCYRLPAKYDPTSLEINKNFNNEMLLLKICH